jgi:antitoxin component YwqK of YwqJK toxin-antitoxin module
MKLLFHFILLCVCDHLSNAQLSLSDGLNERALTIQDEGRLSGYYRNGNKKFEGAKRKEGLHGPWNSWFANGRPLDSGSLKKGIPDGEWWAWYENGNPQFIRTYSADKWQQFQNEKDRYHPKRVSMPLTKLYYDNKRQANKYLIVANTFCAVKNCKRNNEDLQQAIEQNILQQHYHPVFREGLLHGVFANYFPDGAVKDSGNYKNGLPEGMWIKWTDDKQFYWEGHYSHGRKNKEWKLYNANNKLVSIVSFRQGEVLWRKDMKEGVEIPAEDMTGF